MMPLTSAALWVYTTTVIMALTLPVKYGAAAALFESCADHSECPNSASCRTRECDGQICLCDAGYVPNNVDTACLNASTYGERCGTDYGQCTGLNVECNDTADGYCVCGPNTVLSASGTDCAVVGAGRLGDNCLTDSDCFPELVCNGTTCDCKSGFRPATPEEKQAFVDNPFQCRSHTYDLNYCPATEPPTTTTHTATTPITTTEVQTTVTVSAVSLLTQCSDDSQCPESASCLQRECEQICLCNIGYVPYNEVNACLNASSHGERCGTDNGQCTGLNVECNDTTDGYCVCSPNTVLSTSGTDCAVIGAGRLGDNCSTDADCFPELVCNGTTCDCRSGFRAATPEERQAFVDIQFQCRSDTYDLNFCPTTEATKTTTNAATTTTPITTTGVQTTVPLSAASLFTACSDDTRCPQSASCRQRQCDGQICLCDIGYVPNNENNACLNASSHGERCGTDNGQCTGLNVECSNTTDGYCVCSPNTVLSASGTDCAVIGAGRLGDSCSTDTNCFPELFCNGTMCDCRSGFRPTTPEERQAFVDNPFQCRSDTYDLNFCPTTEATTTTTNAATTTTPITTTGVQTTVTLAAASLFTACSDDTQCPQSASCRQRQCDGQICLCDIGYVPNNENNACLNASSHGERCGRDNGQCTGLDVECNDTTAGYCVCGPNTVLSASGTDCAVIGAGRLGDICTTDSDCFPELSCNDTCDCRSGFRPATPEERQAFVDIPFQCRSDTYDLNFCQRTEAANTTTNAETSTPMTTTEIQTTVTLAVARLFSACSNDTQCPESASCRQRQCDGLICLCDIGYVPNKGDTACLKASSYGERCGTDYGQCTGLNVECNHTTDGYCVCGLNTELSASGTDCAVIGAGRLGDNCTTDSDCFPELFCNGTTCDNPFQCRSDTYNLSQDSCSLLQTWLHSTSVYRVAEGVPVGSTIGHLPAKACVVNGTQGPIDVDTQSGRIYVRTEVATQHYDYDYNVSFCGCPSEWHTVTVYIDATQPPMFSQPKYSLDIIEGSGQYTVIGSFPADDEDTCAEELIYQLHPASVRIHLAIGALGVVRIRRKMYHNQLVDAGIISHVSDRDFTFQISASDGTKNTTAIVVATVLSALKTTVNYTEITVYIAEGLPPGTFVANVHEVLGKTPDAVLSIIQQSRQDVFKVDQLSGNITTKASFDRESRSNYALLLEVHPLGCAGEQIGLEIVVIIDDVNDNNPEFSPLAYSCRVPEASDTLHGLIVAVSDEDSSDNALVELSVDDALQNVLFPRKVDGSTSFNAFTVDVLQPMALDFEMTSVLHVNLTARDLGIQQMSTTADLTIHLLDVNDNPPVFGSSSYFATSTLSSPRALPVLTVSASDKDASANAEISYYVLSGSNGKVSMTKSTGEIRLTSDIQSPETITFQVMAKDNGLPARSAVADVTVVLDGVPQKAPNLSFNRSFYDVKVSELSRQALTVTADDLNHPGKEEIRYTLGQNLDGDVSKLVLNSTTGEITFSSPLDYETSEERFLLFDVHAGTLDNPVLATATVLIEIMDNNDESPIFNEDYYEGFFGFSDPPGTPLLYVRATDLDGTPVRYSLGQEFDASSFNIDSDTGLITLDTISELQSNDSLYSFTVWATDDVNTARSNVTITALNITAPVVFRQNATISEQTAVAGGVIDIKRRGFQVEQFYGPTDVFQLAQDGLVPLKALDREMQSTYTGLYSGAGVISRVLTLVTIDVLDVNDNPPRCDRPYYRLTIQPDQNRTGQPDKQEFPSIVISDADLPPNNTWSASLSDYSSIFRFAQGNVELVAHRRTLNSSTYEFRLNLVDNNNPRLFSTCWLHVEVLGVNSITFYNLTKTLSLSEDLPVGAHVLTLKAVSQDGGTRDQLVYSLSSSSAEAYLSVDELSGEVTLSRTLDYETDSTFVITVQAFYTREALSASATISILVEDYNDNMPVFGQIEYYKEIKDNPEVGDVLITVTATDDDEGPAGDVTYAIEGCGETFFAIDARTGDITLAKPLGLVYYPNISLVVSASDGGKYRRISRALVLFTIPNFNPTPPKFVEIYSNITVVEEVKAGLVFTVRAFDLEDNDVVFDLPPSQYSEYFEVGKLNGEIRLKKPLDREQIKRDFEQSHSPAPRRRRQTEVISFCRQEDAEVIPLVVQVMDNGVPRRSARICLRIFILDSNDHRPVFNTTEVTLTFTQTFEKNVERTLPLTAIDEDDGDFGEVFYAITSKTSYFKVEKREEGPTIVALRDCEECKQTKDYQFQQVTVYAYNKDDVIGESGLQDQLLTVNILLSCGDHCGLSTIEIVLIPLCSLLALAVILLVVLFVRQYKRHKLYTEGTDRRNLEKLREAQGSHFQPRDETYNQPDEEESEFPITHVLRDGYLTPRQGDSGQTSNLYRGGLLSDEGYRSQESDMDYFAQQQASREFPRVENFNSNPDFTREYFVPLSSSGYSNRVAVSTTH